MNELSIHLLKNERKDGALIGITFERNGLKQQLFGNTLDELIDGLENLRNCYFTIEFVRNFSDSLSEQQLARLDSIVVEGNDVNELLSYAELRNQLSNVDDFEEKLLSLNASSQSLIDFSTKFQGKNFEKIEDAVLEIKCINHILALSNIECANIEKIKNAVLETNDVYFINLFLIKHPEFINQTKDTDISQLQDAVINLQNPQCICHFAKNIEGADIDKLQDAIISCKDSKYIYEFAKGIQGADICKLRRAMKKSHNTFYYDYKKQFKKKFPTRTQKFIRSIEDKILDLFM